MAPVVVHALKIIQIHIDKAKRLSHFNATLGIMEKTDTVPHTGKIIHIGDLLQAGDVFKTMNQLV